MGKDHGDRDTVGQQADDIATSAAFEMIVRGAVGLTGVRRDGDAIIIGVIFIILPRRTARSWDTTPTCCSGTSITKSSIGSCF